MPAVTIRNLPESTHRALKARAVRHGRSTEAEIRDILNSAIEAPVGLGTRLVAIGRTLKGVELKTSRDRAVGNRIGFSDAAIAAIAHANGFALATRTGKDFRGTGIEIVNPWDLRS